MSTDTLQVQLFNQVRNKLEVNASLADEVAAVLSISTDSAYRRIRGEKAISLEELYQLCNRYALSIDALLNVKTDSISFQGKFIDPSQFRFDDYLRSVGQQVAYMSSFKDRKLFYLCKDIPLFHHYQVKELAAFKYFFWHKTILQSPEFVAKKLALSNYPDEIFALGTKALQVYNSLDSVELWNMESLNGTLRQVEFYHDTNVFQNDDLLKIYQALETLFTLLETQAERGYKFDCTDPGQKKKGSFQMYFNEVVIGDNSILAELDGKKICFLTHSAINFIMTRDVAFCDNMSNYYQNLIRKSTLISTVSERERSHFFNSLRNRIIVRKQNLE